MRCPLCERDFNPATSAAKPFCSERCRVIDLARWLGESYALPADPQADDGSRSDSDESAADE